MSGRRMNLKEMGRLVLRASGALRKQSQHHRNVVECVILTLLKLIINNIIITYTNFYLIN